MLRYASAITEQKKCWELLADKFDRSQTLRNNIQQQFFFSLFFFILHKHNYIYTNKLLLQVHKIHFVLYINNGLYKTV